MNTVDLPAAGDVERIENISSIINDQQRIADIRQHIQDGATYVVNSGISRSKLEAIRSYLIGIGQGSFPNYRSIEQGCPNFHRVNRWDERAYVKGCFHQFVFFPWNQDMFDFFNLFRPVFELKNKLSNLPANKFLGAEPEDGCTSRLAFQFYPSGGGALNRHIDPVDRHQLTVPVMLLSEKGKDFNTGGLYIESAAGKRLLFDDIGQLGDIVFFNAQITHGVEPIDPEEELNWPSFRGRWMGLFAVNKLSGTADIPNSVDLEIATEEEAVAGAT